MRRGRKAVLVAAAWLLASTGQVASARALGTLLVQVEQAGRICVSRQIELRSLTPVLKTLPCFGRSLGFKAFARAADSRVELVFQARLRTPLEEHWVLTHGNWVTFSDARVDTLSQTVSLQDGSHMTFPLGQHIRIEFGLEAVSPKDSRSAGSTAR